MMSECISTIGFVFSQSKVCVKRDKNCKYSNDKNTRIGIFRLNKSELVSSTLSISTSFDDSWDNFKKYILTLVNANFVIKLKKCNKYHSFYANFVKLKESSSNPNVVLLYFKYNVIPNQTPFFMNQENANMELVLKTREQSGSAKPICANIMSNICYELESDCYTDISFFYNEAYRSNPLLMFPIFQCNEDLQ